MGQDMCLSDMAMYKWLEEQIKTYLLRFLLKEFNSNR